MNTDELVALVQHVSAELRHLRRFHLTAEGQQRKLDSLIVQMEKATTPLPASPQAETMPTIQVGDVVMLGSPASTRDAFPRMMSEARHAAYMNSDGEPDVLAIYRDPLWRRPTKGDE